MKKWKKLPKSMKFSILAFITSMVLSLVSMGALGYGIYYLVFPLLPEKIEELSGDATWPSIILAGMLWSFSFLLAGLAFQSLTRVGAHPVGKYLIYLSILWIWDLISWYSIIHFRFVQ